MNSPEGKLYTYQNENPFFVRLLYAFGMFAWGLAMVGYVQFLQNDWRLWLAFGPLFLLQSTYALSSYGLNLGYKGFDASEHKRFIEGFWKKNKGKYPKVDVYLPVCGENIGVLERTWRGVKAIDYPNMVATVFDDAGDPATKALAEKLGINYHCRPDRGVLKKAGNLRYAFGVTDGDFYLVLDADFVPHPDVFWHLLPYILTDKKIGILQTPQFFPLTKEQHERSPIEYGAGSIQEEFYRVTQTSRDRYGGAICVGTNALYSRHALTAVGGTAEVERSEDVNTGLKVLNGGFKLKYLPLVIAEGICPDTVEAFFNQHNRWCTGSLQLSVSRRLWGVKMGFRQRLCYFSGSLYYVTSILSVVSVVQFFVILFLLLDSVDLRNIYWFVPHLLFSYWLLGYFKFTRPQFGTILAATTARYTYFYSFIRNFYSTMEWVPTNVLKGKASKNFTNMVWLSAGITIAVTITLAVFFATHPIENLGIGLASVLFWILLTIRTGTVFSYYGFAEIFHRNVSKKELSPEDRSVHMDKLGLLYTLSVAFMVCIPFAGMLVGTNSDRVQASVSQQVSELFPSSEKQVVVGEKDSLLLPSSCSAVVGEIYQCELVVRPGEGYSDLVARALSQYILQESLVLSENVQKSILTNSERAATNTEVPSAGLPILITLSIPPNATSSN